MNIETVKTQLKELRMKIAASELDEVLRSQKKTVALDWLSLLLSLRD